MFPREFKSYYYYYYYCYYLTGMKLASTVGHHTLDTANRTFRNVQLTVLTQTVTTEHMSTSFQQQTLQSWLLNEADCTRVDCSVKLLTDILHHTAICLKSFTVSEWVEDIFTEAFCEQDDPNEFQLEAHGIFLLVHISVLRNT